MEVALPGKPNLVISHTGIKTIASQFQPLYYTHYAFSIYHMHSAEMCNCCANKKYIALCFFAFEFAKCTYATGYNFVI